MLLIFLNNVFFRTRVLIQCLGNFSLFFKVHIALKPILQIAFGIYLPTQLHFLTIVTPRKIPADLHRIDCSRNAHLKYIWVL